MSEASRLVRQRAQKMAGNDCPVCHGSRWVCENHPRLAWPDECDCGAGKPCPVCNVAEPPEMDPGFVRDKTV
jgi:hypothetical protein